MQPEEAKPKNPVFIYLGCGCAVIAGLLVATIAGLGWYTYKMGKEFEETMKDPEARLAKSQEVLGFEQLPEGYYPMGSFKIPFVMEMAMLSDRDLAFGETTDEGEAFENRGFVFTIMRMGGGRMEELKDYFEGEADSMGSFEIQGLDFNSGEILDQGTLSLDGYEALYVVESSTMKLRGNTVDRLQTLTFIDCPNDQRLRMGIWFGPPSETAAVSAAAESSMATENSTDAVNKPNVSALDGTVGDPERLRAFLDHFQLCPTS